MITRIHQWVTERLSRKLFFALAASVTVISLALLVAFVSYFQNRLISERATTSAEINSLLQVALENAMLKRDLKGLQEIVERLGDKKSVSSVMILTPKGDVRFSSPASHLGRKFDLSANEFCLGCNVVFGGRPSIALVQDPKSGDVLRSVNPVANKKRCIQCHGSASINPVNGILVVDYDAKEIQRDAWSMALALAGSGAMVLLVGMGAIGLVVRDSVLLPIRALVTASVDLSKGKLDVDLETSGSDEVAELGKTFRVMSDCLSLQRAELAQREAFLQSVIDAVPDGIRVIRDDFQVIKANKAFLEQQGLRSDQVIGHPCYASSHARMEPCASTLVACPLVEVSEDSDALTCQHTHVRKDGDELRVEVSSAPLVVTTDGKREFCIVESIRDLNRDIHHSHEQRLGEIRHLAAGVAHEIRNPLSSMHLSLQAMHRKSSAEYEQALSDHLDLMDHEIDRCIQVTDRLLKLSAPAAELPELVSLSEIIPEVVSLLRAEAESIKVKVILDLEGTLRVVANDSDLRMLVLNLIQNAFHAMPDGGFLHIAGNVDNDMIALRFKDTGVGIAEKDLKRIFQPFWSRRADADSGTGLGLPICREILHRHKGKIAVTSKLGIGSIFTVFLPWAEATAESS